MLYEPLGLQVGCSEQYFVTKLKWYVRNEVPEGLKNTIKLHEHVLQIPLTTSPALSLLS